MDGATTIADRSLERSGRNCAGSDLAGYRNLQFGSKRVEWPAEPEAALAAAGTGESDATSANAALNVRRAVLVVEDSAAVREALSRALAEWRCNVLAVGDVASARRMLATRPFDMLISGLVNGSFAGVELLEHVRRAHPRTIRVLLTGSQDFGLLRDAINRAGVVFFLAKPWDRSSLADLIACLDAGGQSASRETEDSARELAREARSEEVRTLACSGARSRADRAASE